MSTALNLYGSQAAYDAALPPEDPPETPDMYWEIHSLLNREDTDLVDQAEFIEKADERIHDLLKEGFLIDFLQSCATSLEPNVRMLAKPIRDALEQIAGEMLDEAHAEAVKRFQRYGDEP